jgi:hypothetical protein
VKVNYTLAEIEVYVRKAAQATGLSWGLAEEVGKAARWLAAFDLPGPEIALAHLQQLDGKDHKDFFPTNINDIWQAHGEYLCPIVSGAALADRASQILAGVEYKLGKITYPILLVATIGQAARCHKTTFSTSWADVRVSCYENGIRIEGSRNDLLIANADSAICRLGTDTTPEQLPSTMAYSVDLDIWKSIDALAFKTYAPATAESRAGAGAGLTDND